LPGVGCTNFGPVPCQGAACYIGNGTRSVFDNEGQYYSISSIITGDCGYGIQVQRIQIIRSSDGVAQEVVGYIDQRCTGFSRADRIDVGGMIFDAISGRLLIGMISTCVGDSASCSYNGVQWTASIASFPTVAAVISPGPAGPPGPQGPPGPTGSDGPQGPP